MIEMWERRRAGIACTLCNDRGCCDCVYNGEILSDEDLEEFNEELKTWKR